MFYPTLCDSLVNARAVSLWTVHCQGLVRQLWYMDLECKAINLPSSSDNQLAMVGSTLVCYGACRRERHRGTCHGMENVPLRMRREG